MATVPGIFERPKKSGVWWICYYDTESKRHREKAGTRRAAMDLVAVRRREVKAGTFIPPRKGARLTFRELALAAMTQKKLRLAPLSYETDQMRLKQLLPLIGNVPADKLTPDRIEATLAGLRARVSTSTTNRYRSLISSIYAFALRSGRMAVNPVSRVKRYKENDSRLRWLKDDEELKLRFELNDADDEHPRSTESIAHEAELDLALHTGMRRGEQFMLEWKNCDLERGNLTVKGKTGRRHIKANSAAVTALRTLHAISGSAKFVCPDANDSVKRDSRRWLENAARDAKVTDFHWHDLRHTFASRLVMRGTDIRTVQELLGHKSIVMTMRYAHLADDHRAAAVEKMVEAVCG